MNEQPLRTIQVCGGDYLVSHDANAMLLTILGSCVAACICDPVAGIGGMNHFLLPSGGTIEIHGQRGRYGDFAMPALVDRLCRLGAQRGRLQARLYGGAHAHVGDSDIGALNGDFARRFLSDQRIDLIDSDLGGDVVRWVTYHAASGEASLKVVPRPCPKIPPAAACLVQGRPAAIFSDIMSS